MWDAKPPRHDISRLTDHDIFLFKQGSHFDLPDKLGSIPMTVEGENGVHFAVWAPNAHTVSVVGDFNDWEPGSHPMAVRHDASGIFECFIPGLGKGARYKYHIISRASDYRADKGDPYAFYWETSPSTASIVWDLEHDWHDGGPGWPRGRRKTAFPPRFPSTRSTSARFGASTKTATGHCPTWRWPTT